MSYCGKIKRGLMQKGAAMLQCRYKIPLNIVELNLLTFQILKRIDDF